MPVEVVLVLGRWDQADLAVQASMVEPVDVLRGRDLKVVGTRPRALVADQLGLEQRVERLGQSFVVRVAGGADGGDRARVSQALGVPHGDVLPGSDACCALRFRGWVALAMAMSGSLV